jgi:hypothetical protein
MRGIGWLASTTALAATVALSVPASADSMDPALERFVTDTACQAPGPNGTGKYYNPASGFTRCGIDNLAFAKLVAQYGFAIAPSGMHSARTTGYGGFELALEADYTKIDNGADYWKNGTQGPQDNTTKNFSIRNPSPDPMLQVYNLKIRKGFPFGFELQGDVGSMAHTSIFVVGADVRWSIFEGFRTGIPAIFPEVAVGGAVRTITGTPEMQLTVAGFDAQISKPLPIAGTVVLTPYAGYQWIRIFGDSGLVDLTPNTDAVNLCGYSGNNTPATPDPAKNGAYDGQPVCARGSSADFNNTAVFDPVRLTRHRLNFGLQLRYQMIKVGAHFVTDLVSAKDANQGAAYEEKITNADGSTTTVNKFDGVSKQWTLAFDLGAVF